MSRRSPFFPAALRSTSNWKESQENTIVFPEDEPATFDHFLYWAYQDEIQVPMYAAVIGAEHTGVDVLPLVKLYIFADRLQAPKCKSAVIESLYENIDDVHHISVETCVLISEYKNLGSGLHELIMDWFASKSTADNRDLDLFRKAPLFARSLFEEVLRQATDKVRSEWQFESLAFYQDMSTRWKEHP
ncbi:hypothetical protein K461DRAFT_158712 [Myriangium duriaei CBS 260.36]|uniref:BTB domain-containing protein n=1 Tax=Myriangium duriaei CBS 260.36 TaxID=1168546 RepID=A0A9P4J3T8_9PEZI|nr:hypothetical protein K461DRAFT_158712 [Myriangium duriaei CBS 260.36]